MLTPGGKLLARGNSSRPEKIAEILEKGLSAWQALSLAEKSLPVPPDAVPLHRWEQSYPEGGLVLTAVHRDLDREQLVGNGQRWNLDHLWCSSEEIGPWVAQLREEKALPLPEVIVDRWARFHLVDNVRGQEGPFAPDDIEFARIRATVLEDTGSTLLLQIDGATRVVSDGVWKLGDNLWKHFPNRPRGVETSLAGRAVYDLAEERFVQFRVIAIGEAWGGSGLNGRRGGIPEQPHYLAWLFKLAGSSPVDRVPPAFIDIYGVDWVIPPAVVFDEKSPS